MQSVCRWRGHAGPRVLFPAGAFLLAGLAAGALLLGRPLAGAALVNAASVDLARAEAGGGAGAAPLEPHLDGVEARLRTAGALAPDHPAAGRLLARIALHRGDLDEAARLLQRNRDDPWAAALHWRLGERYAAEGREDEAIGAWRSAEGGRALLVEGQRAVTAGQPEEGLRWYRRAMAVEPGLLGAYLGAAGVYERTGRVAEALATYELASTWFPASADGYLRAASLLGGQARRPERVREVLLSCVETAADGDRCLVQLAGWDAQAGRLAEAAAQLEGLLRGDPHNGEAWMQLGNVHATAGRCGEAIRMYLNAERTGVPIWARRAPLQAGRTYRALGREIEAGAAFQRALGAAGRQQLPPEELARVRAEIESARRGPLPANAPRCAPERA